MIVEVPDNLNYSVILQGPCIRELWIYLGKEMYNQKSKCNADNDHQSLNLARFSSTPISKLPPIQTSVEGARDIAVAHLFFCKCSRTPKLQEEKADALKTFYKQCGRQTIKRDPITVV